MMLMKPATLVGKLLLATIVALLALGLFIAAAENFARYRRVADERKNAPAEAAEAGSPLDATQPIDDGAVTIKDGELRETTDR